MGKISAYRKEIGRRLLEKFYDFNAVEWDPEKWHHVVIFIPESIGDSMAIFPIINALEKKRLEWVGIVTSDRALPVFDQLNKEIFQIFTVDSDRNYKKVRSIAKLISKEKSVDCCIDASVGTSSSIYFIGTLRALNNIQRKKARMKAFNQVIPEYLIRVFDAMPTPIWWSRACNAIGIGCVPGNYGFTVPERCQAKVDLWSKTLGCYVVLNLDGAVKERQLDRETSIAIISTIRRMTQLPIVIVYGKSSLMKASEVQKSTINTFLYPGEASVNVTAALVKKCLMVISPDTSIIHMASAFNRPTLGLYIKRKEGPKWHPLADNARVVYCDESIIQCRNYLDKIGKEFNIIYKKLNHHKCEKKNG